jgi:aspartate/tyrosine/aromatic aminotransferase
VLKPALLVSIDRDAADVAKSAYPVYMREPYSSPPGAGARKIGRG